MGSSPIFRIIKETSGDSPEVFFYCTEAIPEPRVQVFAPLRSAQSIRPLDELRPIFRFLLFSNSPFLFRNSFFIPTYSLNPWFRSSLRYGRRRTLVHRTSCSPSSASLPFMPFFIYKIQYNSTCYDHHGDPLGG